uniref:DUF3108 domain-containing protein n=1 Tax=Caenorhabditis tropicalis TaxID=1561998 RepID=A0A1I7TRL1_9PELO
MAANRTVHVFDVPAQTSWYRFKFEQVGRTKKLYLDGVEREMALRQTNVINIEKVWEGRRKIVGTVVLTLIPDGINSVCPSMTVSTLGFPLSEIQRVHRRNYATWEIALNGNNTKIIYDKNAKQVHWRTRVFRMSDAIRITGLVSIEFEIEGHSFNMTSERIGVVEVCDLHMDQVRIPHFDPLNELVPNDEERV